MCFVFVEARWGCGQDAGRAGAAPGGDPREALGATPAAPLCLCL